MCAQHVDRSAEVRTRVGNLIEEAQQRTISEPGEFYRFVVRLTIPTHPNVLIMSDRTWTTTERDAALLANNVRFVSNGVSGRKLVITCESTVDAATYRWQFHVTNRR